MHFLFVDPLLGYGADTSAREPLGGTQSAATHLALALARRGVGVTVANRRDSDTVEAGVEWADLAAAQAHFSDFLASRRVSHLVFVNAANVVALRAKVGWRCAWCLWNHHWIDQPSVAPLANAEIRGQWDAVISVSNFHYRGMAETFRLAPERHVILRNGVGPQFEALFADFDTFRAERLARATTRMIYTSTPFRGLEVLVDAWEALAPPDDWCCTVLSGMSLYRTTDARFDELLARAHRPPSMVRLAPVGQAELARVCAEHDFWAYPCTWIETSCISALEAIAAGLYPLTTDLGALPETLEGFASFVVHAGPGLSGRWTEAAREQVEIRRRDPQAWLERAWERRERLLAEWTWDRRAQEWIEALGRVHPREGEATIG